MDMTRLLPALALLAMSLPADAAEPPAAPAGAPSMVLDGPRFSITGYVWASALTGRASTLPPLPATQVDKSFGDILKDLNGGVMGAAELRLGRWSLLADTMFSQITSSSRLPGPYFSNAKLRSQTFTTQASLLYRVYQNEIVSLDLGAGLRFWNLDTKLRVAPGILNLAIERTEAESWFDPVIGARLITQLGGPWSTTLIGDIGGFGAGSRLTWQAVGTVNYAWSANTVLHFGYRALHVDYRNDRFLYDTTTHGPVVAATYRF